MATPQALRRGALLLALAGAGWLTARLAGGHNGSAPLVTPGPSPALPVASDSMVMVVDRELTATAAAKLGKQTADNATMVVLLDSVDVRVCEDLGRQLRELRHRAGPALPLFVLADSAALGVVRTFARRERLQTAGFVAIGARQVMAGGAALPTPAVLIVRGRTVVAGVGHPRRFANIRVRSFADELSAYLPAPLGSTFHPGTRRLQ